MNNQLSRLPRATVKRNQKLDSHTRREKKEKKKRIYIERPSYFHTILLTHTHTRAHTPTHSDEKRELGRWLNGNELAAENVFNILQHFAILHTGSLMKNSVKRLYDFFFSFFHL